MATRTARQVITDAFHRMGFISEDEALTADQIARGLPMLNDMMNGFGAEGIQYVHTDLLIDDTLNVPDEYIRSVGMMFMDEASKEYGKTLTPSQQLDIDRARGALQAYYFAIPVAQQDDGIRNRQRLGYYTSINYLDY